MTDLANPPPLSDSTTMLFRRLDPAARAGHVIVVANPNASTIAAARRVASRWPLPTGWSDRWRVGLSHYIGRGGRRLDGGDRGGAHERAPFRAPHHTVSVAGLLGGGSQIRPGEVTLAYGGVLLIDHLPEFSIRAIESLCDVLDTGEAVHIRAARTTRFPARFRMIATALPCPCGMLGHATAMCACSPSIVRRYRQRWHSIGSRDDVVTIDATCRGIE